MKAATIKRRRRLADGRKFIQICCPYCQRRHWLPESATGSCPRRNSDFSITPERTNA
jgi:hypothetical protein